MGGEWPLFGIVPPFASDSSKRPCKYVKVEAVLKYVGLVSCFLSVLLASRVVPSMSGVPMWCVVSTLVHRNIGVCGR